MQICFFICFNRFLFWCGTSWLQFLAYFDHNRNDNSHSCDHLKQSNSWLNWNSIWKILSFYSHSISLFIPLYLSPHRFVGMINGQIEWNHLIFLLLFFSTRVCSFYTAIILMCPWYLVFFFFPLPLCFSIWLIHQEE